MLNNISVFFAEVLIQRLLHYRESARSEALVWKRQGCIDAYSPDSLHGKIGFDSLKDSREMLHVQDVAVAYGFNNMKREIPSTSTFGRELPLMQLTEGLRNEIKDYTESLTWALCSRAENFGFMNREDDGKSAVSIGNPATAEFEVCRTTLLPGTFPHILTQVC